MTEGLADVHAAIFHVLKAAVRDAAYHRGLTLVCSNRRVNERRFADSPLLMQAEEELREAYASLQEAIASH